MGQIDGAYRASVLAAFRRAIMPSLKVIEVTSSSFRMAARFADQHATGLRAADALHLAIASENAAPLCTLDERLASAGLTLGVETRLL